MTLQTETRYLTRFSLCNFANRPSPSTTNLTLFCCFVGSKTSFSVDISTSLTFDHLKDMIKQKKQNDLKEIDADKLELFKVDVPDEDDLETRVKEAVKDMKPLRPSSKLSKIFLDEPAEETIHIAVKLPNYVDGSFAFGPFPLELKKKETEEEQEQEEDEITRLNKAFSSFSLQKCATPSTFSNQPEVFSQHQAAESPVCNGRYPIKNPKDTTAIPIEVYHPVFAFFKACLQEEPEEEIMVKTFDLMAYMSGVAQRADMRPDLRDKVYELLGQPLTQVTTNHSIADHNILLLISLKLIKALASLVVIEDKPEKGKSGDGVTQAIFSYRAYWTAKDKSMNILRAACCCPSFLVSIEGPYLFIVGAVTTSHIIAQHLVVEWIGNDQFFNKKHVRHLAVIFTALRKSLVLLADWYNTLSSPPSPSPAPALPSIQAQSSTQTRTMSRAHSSTNQTSSTKQASSTQAPSPLLPLERFFPLATSYIDDTNRKIITFKYEKLLKGMHPNCAVFLASECGDSPKKIVVKFVQGYCEEAHRLLADKGYAPRLLYCGPVWTRPAVDAWTWCPNTSDPSKWCPDLRMVVMEWIDGLTLFDLQQTPQSARDLVTRAVRLLHEAGYVHGDIRAPNIIFKANADGKGNDEVKILDFDWAGKVDQVRYPPNMVTRDRIDDIEPNDIIKQEHDIQMIPLL